MILDQFIGKNVTDVITFLSYLEGKCCGVNFDEIPTKDGTINLSFPTLGHFTIVFENWVCKSIRSTQKER